MGTIRYPRHVTREPGSVTLFITSQSFVRLRIFSAERMLAPPSVPSPNWFELCRTRRCDIKANKRQDSHAYFMTYHNISSGHYHRAINISICTLRLNNARLATAIQDLSRRNHTCKRFALKWKQPWHFISLKRS